MLLDTPICNHGWEAPDFKLKDFDGNSYGLNDVIGEKGLLVAFICNHCPYVHAIIDRLIMDAKTLNGKGIGIVAIMSNDYFKYPDDAPEKMKIFAENHKMFFPYLVDETQEVAKSYDAVCTPDFFGFNAHKQLQYRGRLDNLKIGGVGERTPELLEAMQLIIHTGEGPEQQIPSQGCSIKWK